MQLADLLTCNVHQSVRLLVQLLAVKVFSCISERADTQDCWLWHTRLFYSEQAVTHKIVGCDTQDCCIQSRLWHTRLLYWEWAVTHKIVGCDTQDCCTDSGLWHTRLLAVTHNIAGRDTQYCCIQSRLWHTRLLAVTHKIVVLWARGLQLNTVTLCSTAELEKMFRTEKLRKYLISNKTHTFLHCNVLCLDNIRFVIYRARGSDEWAMEVETKLVSTAAVIKFVRRMTKYTYTGHNIKEDT